MSRIRRSFAILAGIVLVTCSHWTTVLAHPGHGDGAGQGTVAGEIRHHVAEPVHAIPIALSILASGLIVLWGVHRISRSKASGSDTRS